MKLVIGLGNLGKEYLLSRHNLGFMVAEKIAAYKGTALKKMFWFPARQARCDFEEHIVRVVAPTTYMNRSGQAVWGAMKKWKIAPEDIVVVYDDVDVDFGEIRVRAKGSAGSHNGMKSVLEWLQTDAFTRVRVGIGPKPEKMEMVEFVLGAFADAERLKLEKVVEQAVDAVESIFSIGTERTMNQFNRSKRG